MMLPFASYRQEQFGSISMDASTTGCQGSGAQIKLGEHIVGSNVLCPEKPMPRSNSRTGRQPVRRVYLSTVDKGLSVPTLATLSRQPAGAGSGCNIL